MFARVVTGVTPQKGGYRRAKDIMPANREDMKNQKNNIWDEILGKHKEPETQSFNIEGISKMTLLELSRRNMGIEIFSEILNCKIWLCSNDKMTIQIKRDNPQAACYTVDELRYLLNLKVSPEELKRIHDAKATFIGTKIIDSKLKNGAKYGTDKRRRF